MKKGGKKRGGKGSRVLEQHHVTCLISRIISSVCMQCYIFLDDAQTTAQILEKLARGSEV